jgi:hypothetical protein
MATTVTHKHTIVVDGRTFTYDLSFSGEANEIVEVAIANGQTDKSIELAVDFSAVEFFLIVSTAAITIETNDGTTPDDTIVLVANKPYIYSTAMLDTFKITADVTTKLFATNASGSSANVTIIRLQDAVS